jgi:Tol biopolymer transport system component
MIGGGRGSARLGSALGALVAVGLLHGCQGPGVPDAELPALPLAVAWRAPELARQRAEYLAGLDPVRRQEYEGERWSQFGVLPIDELRPTLEGLLGTGQAPSEEEYAARLALLHADTGDVSVIPAALRGARPQAWSRDRSRLLFSQLDADGLQLYEYDLEREQVRPLTHGPSAHPRGCYGPDGRLVVMTATLEKGRPVTRIALTDAGGLNPEPLSPGPLDHSPACAPDGRSLVYVATPRAGRDQLFSLPLDGEPTPRRLGPGREPAFSPDGWVLFSARVDGQWQIWRIRPDGRGRARVGTGVLDESQPAGSPDGGYVAYVVEEEFRRSLYVRRLDGTGDRILFRDGDVEFPVW